MGLDSVELLLSIEEEFGVTVEDRDAESLTTPRLLAEYVASKLGGIAPDSDRCLSHAGFHRIRSVLIRNFGARRNEVRPDSPINQFLAGNIRARWRELKEAIGATQLPGLKCRKRIAYGLMGGMPLAGGILLFLGGTPAWTLLAAIFVLWGSAAVITERLADVVPDNLATVRALVPYVGIEKRTEWTQEYVLRRVIQITSVQLGIPIDEILPDHHFVKDLGLDS